MCLQIIFLLVDIVTSCWAKRPFPTFLIILGSQLTEIVVEQEFDNCERYMYVKPVANVHSN